MTGIVAVVNAVFPVVIWVWIIWSWVLTVRRERALPGTLERYRWSTVEWPTRFIAVAGPILGVLHNVGDLVYSDRDHPLTGGRAAVAIVFTLIWAINVKFTLRDYRRMQRLDEEDDDTWFKRTGKRLKRWLRRLAPTRRLAPASAGAR